MWKKTVRTHIKTKIDIVVRKGQRKLPKNVIPLN